MQQTIFIFDSFATLFYGCTGTDPYQTGQVHGPTLKTFSFLFTVVTHFALCMKGIHFIAFKKNKNKKKLNKRRAAQKIRPGVTFWKRAMVSELGIC